MLHTPFIIRPRSISSANIAFGIPYVLAASAAAGMSTTGNTNENTLASVTIPAGAMGANGILRVTSAFTYSNSANTKVLRVKFGGTTYSQASVTTTASHRQQTQIANANATNSQVGNNSSATSFGASSGAVVTSAVDTTAAVTLLFTGQNGNSGETITLSSYLVELLRMP